MNLTLLNTTGEIVGLRDLGDQDRPLKGSPLQIAFRGQQYCVGSDFLSQTNPSPHTFPVCFSCFIYILFIWMDVLWDGRMASFLCTMVCVLACSRHDCSLAFVSCMLPGIDLVGP